MGCKIVVNGCLDVLELLFIVIKWPFIVINLFFVVGLLFIVFMLSFVVGLLFIVVVPKP